MNPLIQDLLVGAIILAAGLFIGLRSWRVMRVWLNTCVMRVWKRPLFAKPVTFWKSTSAVPARLAASRWAVSVLIRAQWVKWWERWWCATAV